MGPLEPGKWLVNFLEDQPAFFHSFNIHLKLNKYLSGQWWGGHSVPGTVEAQGGLRVNQLDEVPLLRERQSRLGREE